MNSTLFFFYFLNMATRDFKTTSVAHAVFLLESADVEHLTDFSGWNHGPLSPKPSKHIYRGITYDSNFLKKNAKLLF